MSTRYLIGRGELLTRRIDAPKKRMGEKARPYTLSESQETILPQIGAANEIFAALPAKACPGDIAVARLTLHPAYIAKTYFPKIFLDQTGLASVGSRTLRIHPRNRTNSTAPVEADTTELFVAGQRSMLRQLPGFVRQLTDEMPIAKQFAEIEAFAPMVAVDRIRSGIDSVENVFEVGLHLPPEGIDIDIRAMFNDYAAGCGFHVHDEFAFTAGRLLFLAVEGEPTEINRLAQFTMMRVVRGMPKLRGVRPMVRSTPLAVSFGLPSGEPLSKGPKVGVLDGGLPDGHLLGSYIRRYFQADPAAQDVPEYLAHGLGVTSALLFGPIEPGSVASRPYAPIDHHRVLDAKSNGEDQYELYRTLAHVETVLLSRQYKFINLSLGPNLAIEDHDVHAWTAVIDSILSDGETVMTVAVGNNGERDDLTGLSRIQVPADSVNALSVGAADHTTANWRRAPYSAKGPGRSPGRRKPDLLAFGGSPQEYFHVVTHGSLPEVTPTFGTSFAAPLALRSAVGISAILGDEVHPLTIKALLIHGCEGGQVVDPLEVGWGRVPDDLNKLITCDDGVARIIYQGELLPGKFLRAPVPLPKTQLLGNVKLLATFCYASPVDPQDAAAYTKAGLSITFRPHHDKRKDGAANAISKTFFPEAEYRPEAELRSDLGKWETVLHAGKTYRGSSLLDPVFDVHYNAREAAGTASSRAPLIRYALVVTIVAPRHPQLHQEILKAHNVLQALVPQIAIPIRL